MKMAVQRQLAAAHGKSYLGNSGLSQQDIPMYDPGGGRGTWYNCPIEMCCVSGYHFRLLFLERDIKRRKFFWSPLSKHVKGENFVRSGYYLVQFLRFEVYFFTDFF